MATRGGFDWDEPKAASNEAKHGIAFHEAIEVFDDPGSIEVIDDRKRYGEERLIAIGLVSGVPISVVYTMRGTSRRIISARPASRKERQTLSERNSRSVTHGDRSQKS